jgi:dihydroorotase-like cyclic amidohydrolase
VTSEVADLLVKNARLPGGGDALSDIAISDGIITEIGPWIEIDARAAVDARRNLVTPSSSMRICTSARSGPCR